MNESKSKVMKLTRGVGGRRMNVAQEGGGGWMALWDNA